MAGQIKAIETIYNGYRFRSRLEARWAVLFDSAGIRYEYESEGFELQDGTKYLPDFYLPDYDWHIEVKAPREGAGKELARAKRFIDGKSISVLLLLGNIPEYHNIDFWFYPALFYNPVKFNVDMQWVTICPYCDISYGSEFCTDLGIETAHLPPIYNDDQLLLLLTPKHEYELDDSDWRYSDAAFDDNIINYLHQIYNAARQARFEYGETPKVPQV